MARLQILQLPEGVGDERPPFLLVIDQVSEAVREEIARWPGNLSERFGARQVLCFTETIDIPANGTRAHTPQRGRRCGEHDGPCFPEPGATCVAHGDTECLYCHRNPADCAAGGNCGTWARTGMHWDSCANRVRGSLASDIPDDHQTPELVYAHERTRLELCDALCLSRDTTWRQLVGAVGEQQKIVARVLGHNEQPEVVSADRDMTDYVHGYGAGVRAVKRTTRNEKTQAATG